MIRRALAALLVVATAFGSPLVLAQTKPAAGAHHRRPKPRAAADAGAAADKTQPEAALPPGGDRETKAGDGESYEARTLDGGTRVFRFGEIGIEGRLRNPQLVYFLRRVRAEFAAGNLGHRTFMRELSDTRHNPNF